MESLFESKNEKAMGCEKAEEVGEEEEIVELTLLWLSSVNFPCEGRGDVVLDCVEACKGGDEEHPVREDAALAVGEIWRGGKRGKEGRRV